MRKKTPKPIMPDKVKGTEINSTGAAIETHHQKGKALTEDEVLAVWRDILCIPEERRLPEVKTLARWIGRDAAVVSEVLNIFYRKNKLAIVGDGTFVIGNLERPKVAPEGDGDGQP